jgi:hypothetical protein
LAGVLATCTVRPVVFIKCAPINAFAALSVGLSHALVVYLGGVIGKFAALSADCYGWSLCQSRLLLAMTLHLITPS